NSNGGLHRWRSFGMCCGKWSGVDGRPSGARRLIDVVSQRGKPLVQGRGVVAADHILADHGDRDATGAQGEHGLAALLPVDVQHPVTDAGALEVGALALAVAAPV